MNATHEEPASVLPPDMLYLGVQGIARMLGYSVGYTRDRIVVRPDFPAAIKIGGRAAEGATR